MHTNNKLRIFRLGGSAKFLSGQGLFTYFLVSQKVRRRRQSLSGLDFSPAKGGPPEVSLPLSMQFFQATA
jgi:hypothetical protein